MNNVIREPRRELTESVIGIFIAAVVVGLLYLPSSYLSSWFQDATGINVLAWLWTSIFMVFLFFGTWIVLLITHGVGAMFCDNLAQRGIELRGERWPRR